MQFKIEPDQRRNRGVYRITNEVNGNFYVGSAERFWERWQRHAYTLRAGNHANAHLQHAFHKYGEEALVFSVVSEVGAPEDLRLEEQAYLTAYFGPGCYNLSPTAGSVEGYKHSDLSKERMSLAQKGKIVSLETRAKLSAYFTGRKRPPHTAATKAKMSLAGKGHVVAPATRKKISVANTGKPPRTKSPETRTRMSEARSRYWQLRKAKEAHVI